MGIDDERAAALDPWSIRVYQQLQAGYSIDSIKAQFERVIDATPEDVSWILDRAKARYIGYFESYKMSNRDSAKWMLWAGPALALAAIVLISTLGWSTAGRQNGLVIWTILVGIGLFGYGVWCWIDAEPEGRRSDIDQL